MRTAFPHETASVVTDLGAVYAKSPLLGDKGTNQLRWKFRRAKSHPFGTAGLAGAHGLSQDRLDVFLHSRLICPYSSRDFASLLTCCNQEKNLGFRI